MARSGPRPGLDAASVLRAAAELADAEGFDTLSLARLAQVLKVRTPSLYNHVAGLEGVRRGLAVMGVRALRDRIARAAIGKRGGEAVLAMAEAYRQFAKEHPGLYAASVRAPGRDESELATAAADILAYLHTVLEPFGQSDEAEVHAIRAFRSVAHGFSAIELAGGFGIPVDLDTSYRLLVQALILGLERQAGHKQNGSA